MSKQTVKNVKLNQTELEQTMKERMEIKPDPSAIPNLDELFKKTQKLLLECQNDLKDVEKEENELTREIDKLEKNKDTCEKELLTFKKEKLDVTEQLTVLEKEITACNNDEEKQEIIKMKDELNELSKQIDQDYLEKENQINQLKKEIKIKTKKIKNEMEPLKKRRSEIETRITRKYLMEIPKNIIDLMLEKCRFENLERLRGMFNMLKPVQQGLVDIESAQKNFNEKLNNEYVYPKFGGKAEFEKQMANESKIKSKKK